jgi:hypothetical protein
MNNLQNNNKDNSLDSSLQAHNLEDTGTLNQLELALVKAGVSDD